ncbi:MAG: tetratricopeptide repeat protein [Clostridiales bacterium]|nr:tetratricopeptide repeat protein [Clostridiales bacterium]
MSSSEPMIPTDLSAQEFVLFRDYIHEHSGIYLEEAKLDSLRISLITRATRFGLASLREYLDLLQRDDTEFRELMNLVTINETSFFRFPAQFSAMRDFVVPEILERKDARNQAFRVWSAGCSTGEEPYSIAMTLIDAGIEGAGHRLEVTGTDVSSSALAKAQAGWYPARALTNVAPEILTRFFDPTGDGYHIRQDVRKIVDFGYHNLIKEPYPIGLMGNWDIIFCRNVTIYFRLESTRRVVNNFFESLNPGGYLFIGHSETLTSITDRFVPVEVGGVFLYRKPVPRPAYSFAERIEAARRGRSQQLGTEASVRASRTPAAQTMSPAPPNTVHGESLTNASLAASLEHSSGHDGESVDELLRQAREASADGRTSDVLGLATRALALEPSCAEAYLLAAFAHADTGDFASALDESNRALDIDPLLASARYVLGLIYLRTDRLDEAMFEFKRTIYTDSDFVLAHLNLGNLYRARGAIEDACREYENALSALYRRPDGPWSVFLGGFRPDLLAKTCERSLVECRKVDEAAKVQRRRRR